jgi:hypothetical protein
VVIPSSHEAILLVTRPPIDQEWLEDELEELGRLVEGGETLELIGRLNAMVASPRRNGAPMAGTVGAAEAAPTSETV